MHPLEKLILAFYGLFVCGSVSTLGHATAAKGILSAKQYLEEVKRHNHELRKTTAASQSAAIRAEETELMLEPSVFSTLQQSVDEKPGSNALLGDKSSARSLALGVSQMFATGIQAKASYNMAFISVENADDRFLPQPEYYEGKPTIELSVPLWRNLWGREIDATHDLNHADRLSTSYQEQLRGKLILLEAEMTYWRLALAQEVSQVQKATLARARKLRDWAYQRFRKQLSDKGDFLQADAALQLRQLELQSAATEQENAARAFDAMRGRDGEAAKEQLEDLGDNIERAIKAPVRKGSREDLQAVEQQVQLADAGARLNQQKYAPTLDLFGGYSLNSKEAKSSDALSKSFKTDNPTTTVGLRFNMLMDRDLVNHYQQAYLGQHGAAQAQAEHQRRLEERTWKDLETKLAEVKERLSLTKVIEKIQKEKVENERLRHQHGRTTTYQVLNFEQDYATAKLSRLRAQVDALRIVAEMKTYGDTL